MRHASRLDKVRWLIVYSTDIIHLIPLIGFVDLYLRRQAGLSLPLLVGASALLLVFVALSTRPFRIAVRDGPRPTAILAVSGAIAVVLAAFPIIWPMPVWLAILAPFVRRRTITLLSIASVVGVNLRITAEAGVVAWPVILIQAVLTAMAVCAVHANLWLWRVTKEAHEGQEIKARLAVSEERLRFARDLNDLLGHSLADISARTAVAENALRLDPAAAAAEMFEVRDLTRQSLREVRAVVQNYRALDLDEVLASVRAVLEAADVRCTVRAETGSLPAETRTLLATVVREGATNVLKHSKAGHCTITIKDGVLEMSNDGVGGPVGEHAPNGLGGLSQRVTAAGGTLSAAPTPDGAYLLKAEVPA
ncbi:histidine kinase [Nonomuraea sp. NPDC000554]|uniref:sensor histidine kinase n=1 Tax=Nonomuraea sp. NPDC000554 TaxID=3154259 RepID=UPI0033212D1C